MGLLCSAPAVTGGNEWGGGGEVINCGRGPKSEFCGGWEAITTRRKNKFCLPPCGGPCDPSGTSCSVLDALEVDGLGVEVW